jgi:hypothetical protein
MSCLENLTGRDHFEDLEVHVQDNIRMDLREIERKGEDWTQPAQHRDQWWITVNTVMNLRVPQNVEEFVN